MSDVENPFNEGVNAEDGSETWEQVDGETGDDAVTDDQFDQPEEYDFLDTTELGGKHVKMTVDGEEVVVPLSKALDGYNAASVSTKRFQEASEKARQADEALRLQAAFTANPALTVQLIASQQGMSVEDFLGLTPRQQQAAYQEAEEDPYADPLELRLNEQAKKFESLERQLAQRDADERLMVAVGGLKQQYGATDEQTRAVVMEAMNRGLQIDAFPMIFESLAFRAQQQAGAQQTAQQQAEAQRRKQSAQAASRTVSQGSGAAATSTATPAERYGSLREAIAASLDEVESRAR